MQPPAHPEILAPRVRRAGGIFDDENLDLLSHVLDDFIRIPGTSIRFGLDGIVGVVPGIGDVIGGIASCIIILAAWIRGVPYVTVARMVANIGIEVILGSVPIVGDMFDIAWRANRRNYALLTGSLYEPRKHSIRSWLFLGALCLLLFVIMLAPMLLVAWLASDLIHHLFGVRVQFHTWV